MAKIKPMYTALLFILLNSLKSEIQLKILITIFWSNDLSLYKF